MNGHLCIGGAADGQYHNVPEGARHGDTVRVFPRMLAPVSAPMREIIGLDMRRTIEIYKVWQWSQGSDQRVRHYLIPPDWDGFEAMDWMERKAYGDER